MNEERKPISTTVDSIKMLEDLEIMAKTVDEIRAQVGHLFSQAYCMQPGPTSPDHASARHNWEAIVESFHELTFNLDFLSERIGGNGAWYLEDKGSSAGPSKTEENADSVTLPRICVRSLADCVRLDANDMREQFDIACDSSAFRNDPDGAKIKGEFESRYVDMHRHVAELMKKLEVTR